MCPLYDLDETGDYTQAERDSINHAWKELRYLTDIANQTERMAPPR